jgi:hypothetical protein
VPTNSNFSPGIHIGSINPIAKSVRVLIERNRFCLTGFCIVLFNRSKALIRRIGIFILLTQKVVTS